MDKKLILNKVTVTYISNINKVLCKLSLDRSFESPDPRRDGAQ